MWVLAILLCSPLHKQCEDVVVDIYQTEAQCQAVAPAYFDKQGDCYVVDNIIRKDQTPE